MANAVGRTADVYPQNGNVAILLEVAYSGSDVNLLFGDGIKVGINVEFPGDAQPAAIRSLMANAVTTDALGRGLTITGNSMVLPTFQKG